MSEMSRRGFLQIAAGTGVGFAATIGGKTIEKLIPYVTPPDNSIPGNWNDYVTTCRECPAGCGMVVWHRDGRATKSEGNPEHPVNRGALCPRGQSAPQGLYDPDRLRQPLMRINGRLAPSNWDQVMQHLQARIASTIQSGGGRVVILSRLETGTLANVMQHLARQSGRGSVLYYERFNQQPLRQAAQLLFQTPAVPDYRLSECDFILSLSADFLETWISPVEFARQFSDAHSYRFEGDDNYGQGRVGQFVYVGPRMSMTAANADSYVPVAYGAEADVALAMLDVMIARGWVKDEQNVQDAARALGPALRVPEVAQSKIEQWAQAFSQARASVALAGATGAVGPAAVRLAAAGLLLNYAAGRVGQTVLPSQPHALTQAADLELVKTTLESLTSDDLLIIHDCNVAYTLPESASGIAKAGAVAYLGTMLDETAEMAQSVLPLDSPLEAWGDYQPSPGVNSLMQPTMARLWDSRHAGDIFMALSASIGKPVTSGGSNEPAEDFAQLLQNRWREELLTDGLGGDEDPWKLALRRGGIWKEQAAAWTPSMRHDAQQLHAATQPRAGQDSQVHPLFAWPTIMLYDGRTANRSWLQEAPDPTSSACWGSYIDIHPQLAERLGLEADDVVTLTCEGGSLGPLPVRLTELQHHTIIALPMGNGHKALGHNARGLGVNAFTLLPSGGSGVTAHVQVRKTNQRAQVVPTVATNRQHHRHILQWVTLERLRRMKWGDGDKLALPLPEGYRPDEDVYPPHDYKVHRWAMVIDLQRCIGCGACAVACYAENNVAVVGPQEVLRGREMAWLKVVPYHDEDSGGLGFLPMLCQQCDAAPCEPVCPVYASVHNEEGLNAQVYNRCIGTRYCSNNCPYKVRRFNWLNLPLRDEPQAKPEWVKPLDMQLNPEVSVRTRGVMEKCTFCIQRIKLVEYQAARENRPVRDGEIVPACMQTCPANVFTFGDLLDKNSQVSRLTRQDPRRYHVLEELNVKPAITYLRKIKLPQER